MQILKNPCSEQFYDLVSGAKESIKLCAPYVKKEVVDTIYKIKQKDSSVDLVTCANIGSFVSKSLDILAIEQINQNKGGIYNFQQLHAKIYIFDNKKAIVTSANLTYSGLNSNYEYGVFLNQSSENIEQIAVDYKSMLADDRCAKFDDVKIATIKKQIANIKTVPNLVIDQDGEILVSSEDILCITNKFVGWKKDIFEIINSLEGSEFTNQQMLGYVHFLSKKYSAAKTPDRTISRVLQELRDLGLISFTTRGHYKKLWK